MMIRIVCAACAMLLVSCATFDQPASSEPHATVNFLRSAGEGGNLMTQGRILSYFVSANESCSEAPRVAAFATGDFGSDSKSVRLPIIEPVKLLAWLRVNDAGYEGGAYQRTGQFDCSAEAQFTPQNGEDYSVSMNISEEAVCRFIIVHADSGEAPSDLVVSDEICTEKPTMIPD